MVLMAIDHSSASFNAGRIAIDSAYLDPALVGGSYVPGDAFPLDQFLTRWITHLCAPTFLFLSGTSLALSTERRSETGSSPGAIDRHLAIRAAVILGLEAALSLLAMQEVLILQVLYAIGFSMLVMIPLRRLDTRWLLGLALAWLAFGEVITRSVAPLGEPVGFWNSLFFAAVYASPVTVLYPVTGWLAMMMLGWCFGRHVLALPEGVAARDRLIRRVTLAGVAALAIFVVLRGIDGYGNMGLHRADGSLVQWLHVSKYPPGLTYTLLELGGMAVCLSGFMRVERRLRGAPWRWNTLLVFGRTALFFYVLHIPLLGLLAMITTGGIAQAGLAETYVGTAAGLLVLYPLCIAYGRYKTAHPRSLAQYV